MKKLILPILLAVILNFGIGGLISNQNVQDAKAVGFIPVLAETAETENETGDEYENETNINITYNIENLTIIIRPGRRRPPRPMPLPQPNESGGESAEENTDENEYTVPEARNYSIKNEDGQRGRADISPDSNHPKPVPKIIIIQ